MIKKVDVAVIGAGHAGLNAIKEVRKVTQNFVLINGGGLGTTCARIGCMPSKIAIHLAEIFDQCRSLERYGITGADALQLDQPAALEHIRELRDTFVDLVLANTTDEMGEELIEGYAHFLGPNTLQVGDQTFETRAVVIATGAHSIVPPQWQAQFGERILTVETLFEQERLPASVAVIGLGPIGLEMGQVLSRLGVQVTGIESGTTIARVPDPAVNQAAVDALRREFPVWLGDQAQVEPQGDQVAVRAGPHQVVVGRVFLALGRRPNLDQIGLPQTGCALDSRGVPLHDPQTLRVGRLPIYLAGDATGGGANLQVAAEQGRIAGYNACHRTPIRLGIKTPMSIVFSEPNIAWVGPPWSALDQTRLVVGQQRFGPVGRAMIMRPEPRTAAGLRRAPDRSGPGWCHGRTPVRAPGPPARLGGAAGAYGRAYAPDALLPSGHRRGLAGCPERPGPAAEDFPGKVIHAGSPDDLARQKSQGGLAGPATGLVTQASTRQANRSLPWHPLRPPSVPVAHR